jgi:hypothetical protein
MGTRNLEVVVLNGEIRVGNYSQWDGSPASQGMTSLRFLRDKLNKEQFVEKIQKSSWIKPKELKKLWNSVGADPKSDMVDWEVSKKFSEKYPWLHRDCGAKIFEIIQENESGIKLQNTVSFAADSLFCEWAYVVDLDKNTFEIYKGFNETPLEENDRFYFLQKPNSEYYPVKMIKSYSLDNLPTDEEFLEDLVEKEEA